LNHSTVDVNKAPARTGNRLVGRLEIPKLGVSSFILEGVESQTLRVGLGHVPGTSLPGQPGNVVIAGHRDTFFRPLRNIETCDEVSVATSARTYYYQIRSFEVVDPRNVNALRFHKKDELTLITCYPFAYIGPAPKRFIIYAEPVLVPEKCSNS
jgi:sortase A